MAISFPSSPSLNQTYTVGTKTWIWNGYAWDLQIANTDIVFARANAAFEVSNSAALYANSAFLKANTPDYVANSASSYANSAFGVANSALANTGTLVTSNSLTQYIIANTANSTSNTTGALVVKGGMGIDGNVFLSAANTYGTTQSYRLGWTDNYFNRSTQFGGVYYNGTFLAIQSGTLYVEGGAAAIIRSSLQNDSGNRRVLINSTSGLNVANIAVATSNMTGALTVYGGVGVVGNIYSGGVYITGSGNGITFVDGTVQTTNSYPYQSGLDVSSYANSAFATANTITAAGSYANSAFLKANTPDYVANSASSYANAAFATANTVTSASSYANSAFGVANTVTSASSYANSGFTVANSAASYANSAFLKANTPDYVANSAASYANSAFGVANLALANTGSLVTSNPLTQYVFSNTTISTSNTTGSIVVSGGVGIQGNIYASNVYTTKDVYAGLGDGVPLGGATNPIIGAIGNTDQYIQTYQINYSNTANASSDYVAYPNNGTDASGWIDMGITSNAFACTAYSVTGRNEGYLFMSAPAGTGTSGNLVIATDSTGVYNSIEFVVGGFGKGKTNSNVLITTSTTSISNTTGTLQVKGGLGVSGNIYGGSVGSETYIEFGDGTKQYTANAGSGGPSDGSAGSYANSGFAVANSAASYANSAFATANASSGAGAASAGSYANSSFEVANSAASYANAAFAQANTGGGSSVGSYSANIGNGILTSISVSHNLNKTSIITSVRESINNGYFVYPDIQYANANAVIFTFNTAPSSNQYFVSIVGF